MNDRAENVVRKVDAITSGQAPEQEPLQSRALFWPELIARPRPAYLVKGAIDAGCLIEIYGPFGCGKSFLGTDLGLHVALGWDWHGHKVRQAGTLYISAEGGTTIVNRLDAFRRHHEIDLDDLDFAVVIEPTTLLDQTGIDQVIADTGKVPDLGLIVIDTAARVMPGGDEGAESMSQFVMACDHIRKLTGAAVAVIHHSGKDTTKGSRGSTVLPAAADTVIEVSYDAATKVVTANLNKQRNGASGPLLNFVLRVIELDPDLDGDPVTSCVVDPTDRKPAQRTTPKQRKALDELHGLLSQYGKPPPETEHYPGVNAVVDVDVWRQYLFKAGILDKDAKNPRAEFRRLKEQLADRGLIGEWNDLMWAEKSDQEK